MNIEVSSLAILVSFFAGLLASILFYFRDKSLKETAIWLKLTLLTCRFFIVFTLVFLLFSPTVTQSKKEVKHPIFPVLLDNTKSIQIPDSAVRDQLIGFVEDVSKKVKQAKIKILPFSTKIETGQKYSFDKEGTNICRALDDLTEIFPNQNIGGALVISDGINTEGLKSYKNDMYPIFTIGIGDSLKAPDAKIKNLYFNDLVFAGNTFVTEAQFYFENFKGIQQEIILKYDGKEVGRQKYTPKSNSDFFKVNLKVTAGKTGIFPIDLSIKNQQKEKFLGNNSLKRFVTVKNDKLNLLVVSDEPHPDIRAIKSAFWGIDRIDISETKFSDDKPLELINAVLFVGNSSAENKRRWLNNIKLNKKGFVWFTGTQSTFNNDFFKFIRLDDSNDEIIMQSNKSFNLFKIEDEIKEVFENSTPLSVPFGKWKFKGGVQKFMLQKIKNLETGYPQIVFSANEVINYSVFIGSGYWRISLRSSEAFKNLLRKTINYVTAKSDNSQFRINVRSEFMDTEEIIIGAEFYNKLGYLDNLGKVNLTLTRKDSMLFNSELQKTSDKYRCNLGRLLPGVYSVKAKFKKGSQEITKKTIFIVNELNVEAENLSMDYDFLSDLSNNSGGKYFDWKSRELAINFISSSKIFKSVSYFELLSDLVIKFKWIFYILIGFLIIEWILRKWQGVI